MNCSLEDIFNQIAESEKKAEDGKRHMTEGAWFICLNMFGSEQHVISPTSFCFNMIIMIKCTLLAPIKLS